VSIPLTVTSRGQFLDRLAARRTAAQEATVIASRIVVPEALAWWYYQEFGTAPHQIAPRDSSQLVFPDGGRVSHPVQHPGTKPTRSVTKVLDEIEKAAAEMVRKAFLAGALDDPSLLRTAIHEATEEAKRLIVASIAQDLPGSRGPTDPNYPKQSGKLEGRTAAEVFEEMATIEDR